MGGRPMLEMLTGATCLLTAAFLTFTAVPPAIAWQDSLDAREALPRTLDGQEAPRPSIADPALVQRYVESLKESRAALANYRWHARTAIRIDDRELIVQVFDVRLDRQGRLRFTLTGHEQENTALEGPIRRQILPLTKPGPPTADTEQAAVLKRLAESYTHPQPADVSRVTLVPAPFVSLQPLQLPDSTESDDGGLQTETSFRLFDMLRAGDTFEVRLNDDGLEPQEITAQTDLDGAPVEITAEYSRLPDGTVYPARSLIRTVIEKHPIEVRTESFGFEKRGRAN